MKEFNSRLPLRKLEAPVIVLSLLLFISLASCTRNEKMDQQKSSEEKVVSADSYSEKVYSKVDIESGYPGGVQAWRGFLQKTLKYPQKAIDSEVMGTVVVQFVVDEQGNVRETKAISGPDELKEESVRMINASGKWVPAKLDGKSVSSVKKQPIVYRLEPQI